MKYLTKGELLLTLGADADKFTSSEPNIEEINITINNRILEMK